MNLSNTMSKTAPSSTVIKEKKLFSYSNSNVQTMKILTLPQTHQIMLETQNLSRSQMRSILSSHLHKSKAQYGQRSRPEETKEISNLAKQPIVKSSTAPCTHNNIPFLHFQVHSPDRHPTMPELSAIPQPPRVPR